MADDSFIIDRGSWGYWDFSAMVLLIVVRFLGLSLATLSFVYSGVICGFDFFSVMSFSDGILALVFENILSH